MLKLLLFPLAVLLFKFISNLVEYLRCKRYLDKYYDYISGKSTWEFEELVLQIVELFKNAGVQDSRFPLVQPAGYGQVFTGEVSVLSNITHTRMEIVAPVMQMFHRSIGVYRSRMLETFNPLYWVKVVVYLPKQVVGYLGASPDSTLVKVIQVVYWGLVPVLGWLYTLFKTEIDQFIKGFIKSLLT